MDTGEGMDEATLARAMEPFFTTKGVGRGTGLGLSMVHGFAAQSGGWFLLHSERGVGNTAELWLPRAKTITAPAIPAREIQRTQELRHGTVLVVDDDRLVLTSTADMLEDLGYTTIQAVVGQEALELLHDGAQVDLVITDYAMPGMTGIQLAEELHRTRPRLPVLLMTGYAELPGTAFLGIERLAKPINQEALATAIGNCFARAV
jgi:CheY-like chemotaxis protein